LASLTERRRYPHIEHEFTAVAPTSATSLLPCVGGGGHTGAVSGPDPVTKSGRPVLSHGSSSEEERLHIASRAGSRPAIKIGWISLLNDKVGCNYRHRWVADEKTGGSDSDSPRKDQSSGSSEEREDSGASCRTSRHHANEITGAHAAKFEGEASDVQSSTAHSHSI